MSIQVQLKRGVIANRPTLASGELYFGTDTQQLAVGTAPVVFAPMIATQNLTAQAAAIAATTLFTPAVTGFFRISITLKITRAATTSSTLGGSTLGYTHGDDSVVVSQAVGFISTAGNLLTLNNTANTTATVLNGSVVIYAKAGVAVTHAVAYASSGATTMQYSVHTRVESL
jgi:Major tropism determinant N-terminal domain